MSSNPAIPTCLFIAVCLIPIIACWNEEKPIYKWSPVWLNYNRDNMLKRYNDDKPIYKWNPTWLGSGQNTYPGKRYNEDKPIYKWNPSWLGSRLSYPPPSKKGESCLPGLATCAIYRQLMYAPMSHLTCCDGLECSFVGTRFVCTESLRSEEADGK